MRCIQTENEKNKTEVERKNRKLVDVDDDTDDSHYICHQAKQEN